MSKQLSELKNENFWQLQLQIDKDEAPVVEEFFLQSGAMGYFELLYEENKTRNLETDSTTLFFFFASDFPVQAFTPMALTTLGIADYDFSVEEISYQDYVSQFEETFKAFALTKQTWLVPPWNIKSPEIPPDVKRLLLRPGLAFGTGRHATSQLMLEYIEETMPGKQTALDLGTGSGILAIACALYGAEKVWAFDVESLAIDSTRDNLLLNTEAYGLDCKLEAVVGSFAEAAALQCDVFLANILPQVFLQNDVLLAESLRQSKHWALSGVNAEAAADFEQRFFAEQKIEFRSREKGGWLMYFI